MTLSSRLLLKLCIINSPVLLSSSSSSVCCASHKGIYFNVQKYSNAKLQKSKKKKNGEGEEEAPTTTRDATMKYSLTKY